MSVDLHRRIVDRLMASRGQALFVSGIAHVPGISRAEELEATLDFLQKSRRVIVSDHMPPDPHITGVLRIAALMTTSDAPGVCDASRAASARWELAPPIPQRPSVRPPPETLQSHSDQMTVESRIR
jgi:hypothetical protein